MAVELSDLILELRREEASAEVLRRVREGDDPLVILAECRRGMAAVGDRFQQGDYYLAELMLSGELLRSLVDLLVPLLKGRDRGVASGTVVLATPKGDIHDLGKDVFATMLEAHGFTVHDLGVDVAPERIVQEVERVAPDFVGLSALITTSFESMKQTASLLEQAGLRQRLKLMVGGGVTGPSVRRHINADFQTLDAMEGVSYCINVMNPTPTK